MRTQPLSVEQLLGEFEHSERYARDTPRPVVQYRFPEFAHLDVYNPFPFEYEDTQMLIARVEPRADETSPMAVFFYRESFDSIDWYRMPGLPILENVQDPFITVIHDQVVVGGVRIEVTETDQARQIASWETVFYWGEDLRNLEPRFVGPRKMKDIRLVELLNDQVGVFTRPQGEKGGLGKVGFMKVDSLDDLSAPALEDAPLVHDLFVGDEWGGVNQAFPLLDGNIGIFGHIARWDAFNNRQYFPFSCVFDPETMTTSEMQLLCTKEAFFPSVEPKRSDLMNVLFPGGIQRQGDRVHLISGIADTGSGSIEVHPTFAERLVTDTVRVRANATLAGNFALSHA